MKNMFNVYYRVGHKGGHKFEIYRSLNCGRVLPQSYTPKAEI